jgi:glutamate racemase
MSSSSPIGVFDSGIGGLSVLREMRALLPNEDLIYLADSAHCPYGDKSEAYIRARSEALSQFLLRRGAKAVVVACNTATAAAVGGLRAQLAVPVVGMEPAVKPAVAVSRSKVIGVLATVGTLASARFAALLARYGEGVRIVTQPCPGLVEQVERADLDGPETRALVQRYTAPLLAAGADTLILGCTHYPFLRPLIGEIVGDGISLVDTGAAVARQLQRVLSVNQLLSLRGQPGRDEFWTSGAAPHLQRAVDALWPVGGEAQRLPPWAAQFVEPVAQPG